jgi:hypothetical protein
MTWPLLLVWLAVFLRFLVKGGWILIPLAPSLDRLAVWNVGGGVEAYEDVGVDRVLRELRQPDTPQTDYAGLVPTVEALRASLEALRQELRQALR